MAKYLTDEEVFGKSAGGPTAEPKYLSDAEVFGGADNITAGVEQDQSPLGVAKAAVRDVGANFGKALLATGDMVLGDRKSVV